MKKRDHESKSKEVACSKNILETSQQIFLLQSSFFYVNDNQDVMLKHAQIMHCILCYDSPINPSNSRTQAKKKVNLIL
jgi:hypothetical protein